MKKTIAVSATLAALSLFVGADVALAGTCTYKLTPAAGQPGTARVTITNNRFTVKFRRARPNTLYTVWIDFRNRASGELTLDYPLDKGALPRGVAPTFASTAGVKSGMGLDKNAIITGGRGNATLNVTLDYDLFEPEGSPVVGEGLTMHGLNRVGGGWLRVYPERPDIVASTQLTDRKTGLPLLERSTAQGITIVGHPDRISHGHTPGVKNVDHFSAYSGDFPFDCPRPIRDDPDDPDN